MNRRHFGYMLWQAMRACPEAIRIEGQGARARGATAEVPDFYRNG